MKEEHRLPDGEQPTRLPRRNPFAILIQITHWGMKSNEKVSFMQGPL